MNKQTNKDMAAKIFRINYKSDFILTLESDAGWRTPFCIKFWTGAPSLAYFVGWDGETYTHCAYDPSEPSKLTVQFDDHHLPIGDLKYQVAYHFTVADFPNDTEDEVMNQASITTEIDGETYQVMLDFNGETAPEIQFALPAYANEAQRIANEEQRIANEQQRIRNEETRIDNEQTRINQESARVNEYAELKADAVAATGAANDAAALANQKAGLADDAAILATQKAGLAGDAATLATQKAGLADDAATLATQKAGLANDAAALANQKAGLADDAATLATQKSQYAQDKGDYAKEQGDYAKSQADKIPADVMRTASDATFVNANNEALFYMRQADEHLAGLMTSAEHNKLAALPTAADLATGIIYDVSALHPTSGVNGGSTYASLSAALTVIPQAKRKGGMSVKFVQSSDNSYVQYRYMGTATTGTPNPFLDTANWQGVDSEPIAGSDNLVTSGGVAKEFQKVPVETLIGAGNDLVHSSKIYVKPLNKYRVVIKNPNISLDGISIGTGAVRFAIRPYDSNGDKIGTSDIIAVYFRNLNPLENSYEFTPPADTYSIEVLMRAKNGAEQIIWIEDTEVTYDILKDYQPLYYYENKTIVDNGRINEDGTLNIQASSTFRILGLFDLSVLTFGQTLAYQGITTTETSSHKKLYYRYLDTNQTTVVGVGELKNEEIVTIPNGAKFLQFAISRDDLEAFKVKLAYAPADSAKEKDKSLRFAVFSDLHYGVGGSDADRVQGVYNAIVDEMISSHLDFVIFNGDMVDCSGLTSDPDTEYQYLYENLISKIKCPVFFTLGNHDGVTSVKTLEQYYLKGVQCSMETDMFYFVFLNSYYEGTRDTSIPKKWDYDGVDTTFAQAELTKAAALNKIPVIVIHQLGSYSSDSVIAGLLEDFDTKIVIYSHTHTPYNANRTEGYYINPGCFLDNAKTYALCEMKTNAFTSTIVDLTNNTRTPVNVFSTIKEASASIVLYKDKN